MKPIRDINRYYFPARDRAEEIPGRIRRLAKNALRMSKAELARELYLCASAAQEHMLGMSARLTVQERIAERHEYDIDNARCEAVRGFVSAAITDAFDPSGFFVYVLWGTNPDKPLYVGESANIFMRLGTHLGDGKKRQHVKNVQLIRCGSEAIMHTLEARLIREYRPLWNTKGVSRWQAAS